jgi:hypothetical protein
VKAFSALPLHSELYQWHQKKRRSFNADFSRSNRQKTNGARSVGVGPEFDTLYFAKKKNPWTKPTGVLGNCREKKPHVGSPYFGSFSSDRIPKVTTDVNVHFFIQ